jgi:hypothetical protein
LLIYRVLSLRSIAAVRSEALLLDMLHF